MDYRPSLQTLAKYGLTLDEWEGILERQGGVCGVCRQEKDRLVTDHQHAPGWKKMPPERRREYVRGLACVFCNYRILTRFGTIERHLGAARYLQEYEDRKAAG